MDRLQNLEKKVEQLEREDAEERNLIAKLQAEVSQLRAFLGVQSPSSRSTVQSSPASTMASSVPPTSPVSAPPAAAKTTHSTPIDTTEIVRRLSNAAFATERTEILKELVVGGVKPLTCDQFGDIVCL